jgi:hypothetical protein
MLEKFLFGNRLKLELIELKQSDALDYKYIDYSCFGEFATIIKKTYPVEYFNQAFFKEIYIVSNKCNHNFVGLLELGFSGSFKLHHPLFNKTNVLNKEIRETLNQKSYIDTIGIIKSFPVEALNDNHKIKDYIISFNDNYCFIKINNIELNDSRGKLYPKGLSLLEQADLILNDLKEYELNEIILELNDHILSNKNNYLEIFTKTK